MPCSLVVVLQVLIFAPTVNQVLGGATVDVEDDDDNRDDDNHDDDDEDNHSSDGDGFSDEEDEEGRGRNSNSRRRAKRSGRPGNDQGHGKKHKVGSGPVAPTGERARFS